MNARFLLLFGTAALAAYLGMNYLMLKELLGNLANRGVLHSAVYVVWLACGFVVFFAMIVAARRAVLLLVLPLVLVSLVTNYTYFILAKTMLNLDLVEWLPHEARRLPNAWQQFGTQITIAIVAAVACIWIFLMMRSRIRRHEMFRASVAGRRGAGTVAVAAFLAYTGVGLYLQPPNSPAETNLYVFGLPALFAIPPDLRPVSVNPARAPLAEKIVLVVDESILYDMYTKVVFDAAQRLPIVDFGEAASTANCSASSNALLRWGLERARVGDAAYDPRTNPSIWGYARRAGFRTVLIDGQSTGAMQNYITPKEVRLIDEFIPADTGIETDHRIADMLNERLRRPGREFIYVVKRGPHFPYGSVYPAGTLPEGAPRIDKYAAAVRYATRTWFERMAGDLPFSRIVLVYTSDHGQDLYEGLIHCSPRPRSQEYSVPLAVITEVPEMRQLLADASRMKNRAQHVNIFPTLLFAFGYARDWVESQYGATLAGPPSPYLTYVQLSWSAGGDAKKRRTVQSNAFTQSVEFPRRAGH